MNDPVLVYSAIQQTSAWEDKERESYSAKQLTSEYRATLYTEQGLELVSSAAVDNRENK